MQKKVKTLVQVVCMNLGIGLSIHSLLIQILMIILEGEEHSHKGTKTGDDIRLA